MKVRFVIYGGANGVFERELPSPPAQGDRVHNVAPGVRPYVVREVVWHYADSVRCTHPKPCVLAACTEDPVRSVDVHLTDP